MNFSNIIAGKNVDTTHFFDVVSPYSQELIGKCSYVSALEIDQTIVAAEQAFIEVKKMSAFEREEAIKKIVEALELRRKEFAELIVLESGKPIKYALGEVDRAIQTFKIAAEETKRLPREYLDLEWTSASKGKEGLVKYFPIGIICGFTPFNFPLNLVAHKVAPALATGCPIIIKPSPRTPLSSIKLIELFGNSGFPTGMSAVINTTNEDASLLVKDERIKMLSFTGSPKIGWELKNKVGKKRVALELGGNAGVVVTDDADIVHAVKRCVVGGFAYSGQICIHTQRIYVQEGVFDLFVNQFVKETEKLKFGDPIDPNTDVSSMIDEENAIRVENWVNESIENGAKLLYGGERKGSYYSPTVLTGTKPEDSVCCREVFGPVVIIEKVVGFKEAIKEINNSEFGIQAGVFTNNQLYIDYAFNNLDVGGVIINDVPTFRVDHMPYGGVKNSGFGREGVKYAIKEMMEPKILVM